MDENPTRKGFDGEGDQHDGDGIDPDTVPNVKGFVEQRDQETSTETRPKTRSKSSQPKKPKASAKKVAHSPILSSGVAVQTGLVSLAAAVRVPPKNDDNQAIKRSVTVEISNARSNLDVLRLCLRELKWKESAAGTALDPDIYWHASSFHDGNVNFAMSTGRVNKFPGMNDLLRKVHLTRLLNNMRLFFPNEYDFYPKTWFLPEQNQQFKDDVRYMHELDAKQKRRLTTFIVKPSDGSQGEGIYLLRDPSQMLTTKRPHVVQEYIDRPLLLDGLKFDLRIYVLILNLYPLEIYLYDEGLARFATVDYKAPSHDNLHETYMHLTNYSLNRRSVNYKHTVNDQQTDGSKRKLTLVWQQLSGIFGSEKIDQTKSAIRELINRTVLAVVPELRVEYEFQLPAKKNQTISCFQIIGFDIILDNQLKPILLEVNSNPSLRLDFGKGNEDGRMVCYPSLVDEEIKKPLILETLKLALPKRKLDTIARHAKNQANEKIIAERVEKLAQRRLDERNEKMKNARKNRFDLRLNPLFSRPAPSRPKETALDQQGVPLQPGSDQDTGDTSPRQSENPTQPLVQYVSPYMLFDTNRNGSNKLVTRLGKMGNAPHLDDDESGPTRNAVLETFSRLNLTRSSVASESLGFTATRTDVPTATSSSELLKVIFPSEHQKEYEHLFVIDRIADVFIQIAVLTGCKTMTGGQFRGFASACGILDEAITPSSIDILYHQILKRWQQLVLRTTLTGLPFAAFIEAFFFLSQRKFPAARSLLDSANCLINICAERLHSTSPIPNANPQFGQHLLRPSARRSNALASPPSNIRSYSTVLRSSTTLPMRRSMIAAPSARVIASDIPSVLACTDDVEEKPRHKSLRHTTKSVFPLFFDVL